MIIPTPLDITRQDIRRSFTVQTSAAPISISVRPILP